MFGYFMHILFIALAFFIPVITFADFIACSDRQTNEEYVYLSVSGGNIIESTALEYRSPYTCGRSENFLEIINNDLLELPVPVGFSDGVYYRYRTSKGAFGFTVPVPPVEVSGSFSNRQTSELNSFVLVDKDIDTFSSYERSLFTKYGFRLLQWYWWIYVFPLTLLAGVAWLFWRWARGAFPSTVHAWVRSLLAFGGINLLFPILLMIYGGHSISSAPFWGFTRWLGEYIQLVIVVCFGFGMVAVLVLMIGSMRMKFARTRLVK